MKDVAILRGHRREVEDIRARADANLAEVRRTIANLSCTWTRFACVIAGSGLVRRRILFTRVTHRLWISATLTIEADRVELRARVAAEGPFAARTEEEAVRALNGLVGGLVA